MQEIPCLWIGEITGQLKTTGYSSIESRFSESPNVPLVPLVCGELIHSCTASIYILQQEKSYTYNNTTKIEKSHTVQK